MRVNPNPVPDLLAALNQTELQQQEAELQLSTGLSVNAPSDNPTAAAELVGNHDQATLTAGYLQSLSAVQGQLSTASSTLSSINTALQQALSLGVEGANGTLNDSDRAVIVSQLQSIQSQLISLANTSFQGHYIFAGTNTDAAPYVVDGTSPDGVDYTGNADVNQVSIGTGYKIAVNQPGSQLFSASGNDVFLALNNLITALQNNTGIETAVTALGSAQNYLSSQAVFYGDALSQANAQTNYLNTAKLQLTQQQNALGGANLAAEATNLAQDETDNQAALAAISKVQQNTLFSYIT